MKKLFLILLTLVSLQIFAQTTGKKIYIKVQGKVKLPKLSMYDIPTYERQDSAIKHGLSNGDVFKLPPDANGNRALVIVDTIILPNVSYVIDNTNEQAQPGFLISNYDSVHFDLSVDWGDGTIDHYANYASYICLHNYPSSGVFTVTITPSDITIPNLLTINYEFSNGPNQMVSINNIRRLTNLTHLEMEWNKLTASLMDTIQLPSGLTNLGLSGNNLGTFNPANLPSSLITLDLRYNNLTTLPVNDLPVSLRYVSFTNNSLPTSVINDILIHFDNAELTGSGQLSLEDNAPPTGSGITAKANLLAKGWDVTTD